MTQGTYKEFRFPVHIKDTLKVLRVEVFKALSLTAKTGFEFS